MKNALNYCTDSLETELELEDIEAALDNWEEFCLKMKEKFETAQSHLIQKKMRIS